MRIGRMVLASAVGMGATGGWAWGQQQQQQQPPPLPATTTPTAAQATGGESDVTGLAQGIRQAADPSRAVAAYTAAVARVGADVAVEDAYVRRMVEFNLPDMAESQAQDLLKREPNNDVARAVVAYMQGRRGQAVEALGTIVQAAGGDRVVTDPFILHTAGQLVAWYDTRADKGTIPERLKADIEAMRKKLSAQDEYGLAYGAARDAYQGRAPAGTAETGEGQVAVPEASVPASAYDSNGQPMATVPDESVVSPITPYDDSYVYPYTYGYTGAYYYPYNYWPRDYRHYYPSYVPPVIIPRHHGNHDWDHGRNWHDGHHWDGDRDHVHDHDRDHDGGHDDGRDHGHGGGLAVPGGNSPPRVHMYDDMHRSRNRSETPALAPRAIEPPSPQIVGGRVPPPESKGRTYQRTQQPDRPTPAPAPVPRTERRAESPAGGSSVRTAPRAAAQDHSGGGAQQQPRSGGGGGGGGGGGRRSK